VFRTLKDSNWTLGPAPFSTAGFWDAYFDGDPASVETFEQVVAELNARPPHWRDAPIIGKP
jgi:hypothetical protein